MSKDWQFTMLFQHRMPTVQPSQAQQEADEPSVLVVGINYAPEHAGIAPYTTQFCERLRAGGPRVAVLAGVPHYPSWKVPPQFRWRLSTREIRAGVAVQRLRHFVPSRQTALARGAYEASFGLRVALARPPFRPNVVLAVVPSLAGAVAAASMARRAGARLVIWLQDVMGLAASQSGIVGGRSVTGITSSIEAWVLRHADVVIVLNESFRDYALRAGVADSRVQVVPNWSHLSPPRNNRLETRRRLGWHASEHIVLHAGNMGLKQDLGNVVDAARMVDGQGHQLRFVLMGDGSQRPRLEQMGRGLRSLSFVLPVNEDELVDVLAAADVLLVNEARSVKDMSLPSKLTSYFAAGRPVVAAVRSAGGTATQIRESGGGVVVSPGAPEALVAAVLQLRNSGLADAMGAEGQHFASREMRRDIALDNLIRAVLGTSSG